MKQRPWSQEPGQEAFHSSMVTIRVNTFRHLSRSRSRPGKGKQEVIHETTAFRAHVKNSFGHLVWRFIEGSRGSTKIQSFLLSEMIHCSSICQPHSTWMPPNRIISKNLTHHSFLCHKRETYKVETCSIMLMER